MYILLDAIVCVNFARIMKDAPEWLHEVCGQVKLELLSGLLYVWDGCRSNLPLRIFGCLQQPYDSVNCLTIRVCLVNFFVRVELCYSRFYSMAK